MKISGKRMKSHLYSEATSRKYSHCSANASKSGHEPHLVLHDADAHRRDRHEALPRIGHVVEIGPFQKRGIALAIRRRRQVAGNEPLEDEAVGQLRGQHRIEQRLVDDLVDVLAGRHLAGVLGVAGNAAADDDAHQVFFAGQLFAGVVEPAGQLQAAVFGIDHDLDAVERACRRACGCG